MSILDGYGGDALLGGQGRIGAAGGANQFDWVKALSEILGGGEEASGSSILGSGTKALGILGNLGTLFTAYKQLDLGKDIFNFQKDAWNKNYQNEVKNYNTSLADRQNARLSTGDSRYQALSDYMSANKLA